MIYKKMSDDIKNRRGLVSPLPIQDVQTSINVPPETPIFAFSDIHGDIHSLIISLRDCAKVIRKKSTFSFDQNHEDSNVEELLNIDINTEDGAYIDDLNYEWCGTNEQIVIIGDLLDGNRQNNITIDKGQTRPSLENEYPQIEIKIIRFINSLIDQAQAVLTETRIGMIYKLLGNHEIVNMAMNIEFDDPSYNSLISEYKKYIFPNDQTMGSKPVPYYENIPRYRTFIYGYPGYNLLFKHTCRYLLKINGNVFVHGGLLTSDDTYPIYHDINRNLHNGNRDSFVKIITESLEPESSMFTRDFGSDKIMNILYNDPLKKSQYCRKVKGLLEEFVLDLPDSDSYRNADQFKLIVGHCIQSTSSMLNTKNESLRRIVESDDYTETLGESSESGEPIVEYPADRTDGGLIFGISMSCPINEGNTLHRVYRIDVGSSRSFDNTAVNNRIINHDGQNFASKERSYLFSRTPQVLKLTDNTANIIRSKIRNTRIHQPRYNYNQMVSSIPELDIHNPANLHYRNKYLKYKQKYLKLKNISK